ncbi:MAG: SRPBCC domain-containing protein [Bauldia sp.]
MTNQDLRLVIDRTTHSLRFVRLLAATPEEAFAAWTEPEQVAAWWDPAGQRLAECRIDLRPGGAFLFRTAAASHAFSGVYREIAPPERLVFDANGAVGTVRFETAGEATRMTVTIDCGTAENLEQYLRIGVDTGTARTLDNLVAFARAPKR